MQDPEESKCVSERHEAQADRRERPLQMLSYNFIGAKDTKLHTLGLP